MKIRTRILLGFLLIYVSGFYFIVDFIVNEIRPRYLETVEESMNDAANILASLLETELKNEKLNFENLEKIFNGVKRKKLRAKIYKLHKSSVGINVYITDQRGIILYDSDSNRRVGEDYSRWNDVFLTLRGKYGARSTSMVPDDPSTNSIYVAAPVIHNEKILGVITVEKPEKSIKLFIDLAKRKVIIAGIITCIMFIILSIALTFWINRPLVKLTDYVRSLRNHRRLPPPELGVTEIDLLGRTFDEMRQELEGKKYIEHYTQTLTHELKSPLSSIIGSAELLQEDMEKEQRNRFTTNILSESRRIEKIIERLLQLSSIEGRNELRDIETIDLDEMISDLLSSLSPALEQKSIEIKLNDEPSSTVRGERFLIRHSIINLLENAIHFSDSGGIISISIKVKENYCFISIIDNGAGIPEYAQDKIFNRFYSLPSKDSRRKGTGLGLSFVREAALLHNGTIKVYNNHDGGVTAVLSIPVDL